MGVEDCVCVGGVEGNSIEWKQRYFLEGTLLSK